MAVPYSGTADEIGLGASYSCDPGRARFALMADVDADVSSAGVYAPEDEGEIHRVPSDQQLDCAWGGAQVSTDVTIIPAGQGMCEGAGRARFGALRINGEEFPVVAHELHDYPNCFGGSGAALIKLIVEQTSAGLVVTTCTGPSWNDVAGWRDVTCYQDPVDGHRLGSRAIRVLLDDVCANRSICLEPFDVIKLQKDPPKHLLALANTVLERARLLSGNDQYPDISPSGARMQVLRILRDALGSNSLRVSGTADLRRSFEGRWKLVPELSNRDVLDHVVTIEVSDDRVAVRTDASTTDGEVRSSVLSGQLDGEWHPMEPPSQRVEKSFYQAGELVLEYSVYANDRSMSHTRWQATVDGALLIVYTTATGSVDGSVFRQTHVYRREN
jgi:hypothetical protein